MFKISVVDSELLNWLKTCDRVELRREYLRNLVKEYPVITLKQILRLAGTPFKPEEIKSVLTSFEEDGTLVKGFLIEDLDQVCWGRKEPA